MKKNISDLVIDNLLAKQLLTSEQLKQLNQASAAQDNRDILEIVQEKKLVSEETIVKIKGEVLNIPVVDLSDKQIEHDILDIIPEKTAQSYNLVPFAQKDKEVKVAMLNPEDYRVVRVLDFISQQKDLKFTNYITPSYSLNHVLKQYANLSEKITNVLKDANDIAPEDIIDEEVTDNVVKNAPISKTVSVILNAAIEGGASDIHIEPMDKETRVRYRVDGVLHNSFLLPINIHRAIVARIKVLSNLKIDETRIPQDGRFKIKFGNRFVEFRVSTLPLMDREKVVMRILDSSKETISLESLGYMDRNLKVILQNLKNPHGLILITGPTGSGKSTTLYSMLSILNKEEVNIVTLEDPVEYDLPGIAQAQIRPEVGLTFAAGLRSILRQDPDIVMVGEVRDKETAELAVHAALTGHMVLSTLHTNDALGAIPRLIDMGIESFLISSSLNLVIAQRLIRRICPHCKQEYQVSAEQEEEIFAEISKIPAKSVPADINLARPYTLYKGQGCARCDNSGYHGRIAIAEALEVTNELNDIISNGKINSAPVVKKEVVRQGMLNVKQEGILKALRGLTTIEEVYNATKE